MKKRILLILGACMLMLGTITHAATTVPGHTGGRYDKDNNGIPDAGVSVNGHYTAYYGYDQWGNWYWDLGDGRILGNVGSPDDLDPYTVTDCYYVISYRADFGNDSFMNSGWIKQTIRCVGYEPGVFTYHIVHESDPRYTGDPEWAVWGNWEYIVLAEKGVGNAVHLPPSAHPETPVGH